MKVRKPESLDRSSESYQTFLAAALIIGRTARDMGSLTGDTEKLITDMAKGMAQSGSALEIAECTVLLMYEMACREIDEPASRVGEAMKVFPFRIPADALADLRTLASRRGAEPSVLVREWVLDKLNQAARRVNG